VHRNIFIAMHQKSVYKHWQVIAMHEQRCVAAPK
jgi:hypothetical protein